MSGRRSAAGASLLAFALGALAGCTDGEESLPMDPRTMSRVAETRAALAERVAVSERAAAASGDNSRGIESEILRIESQVAGLGGMFFDPISGRMVVLVRDQAQNQRARAIVQAYLARAATAISDAAQAAGSAVETRASEYAFSQLVGWSRVMTHDLLRIPGWVAIDADEQMNRVRITIEDERDKPAVETVVSANGVPRGAVQIEVGPRMDALITLRDRLDRPVGGGAQISNSAGGICSLGWTVNKPDGSWGFLTAGHCTSYGAGQGSTGDTFYQTSDAYAFNPADAIGTVEINPVWNQQCVDPGTGSPYAGRCTSADAIFVSSDRSLATKKTAQTADGSGVNNQPGSLVLVGWQTSIRNPDAAYVPAVGYHALKDGRTTGSTRGVISGTCETHRVCEHRDPYTGSCMSDYVLTCQGRFTNASVGGGDSGGPVQPRLAKPRSGPPTPLRPWGITVAGGPMDPAVGYCRSNCTVIFSTVEQIRVTHGQDYDFGSN